MQKYKDEQEYIDSVLTQVRWKAAHGVIATELLNHIADQREAFLEADNAPDEAAEMAIAEMGDSFTVGLAFDKAYRPKIDWVILAATFCLLSIGVFACWFSGEEMLINDFILYAMGGAILLAGCFCDYRKLFLYAYPLYFGFMILFAIICFFGVTVNGNPVWPIFVGIVGIRELLVLFPIIYSLIIYKMKNKGIGGLLFCGVAAAVPFLWSIMENQLGAVVVPGIACYALLFMAVSHAWFGSSKKLSYGILCTPVVFVIGYIYMNRYRFDRLTYAINPWSDPRGGGYQSIQLRNFFINAEWIGNGNSTTYNQFAQFVPDSNTYFSLAHITQYFGMILFLLVACVIFVLLFRSNQINRKQKSIEGKLIVTAALLVLGMCFVFGLLANMGILLIPSIKLPLVSYRGVVTLIYLLYIAILLSALRNTPLTNNNIYCTSIMENPNSRLSIKDGVVSFRFKD